MTWQENGISAGAAILTEEEIQALTKKLAAQISGAYQGKELVVLGVLKGAFIFMADLIRQIPLPLTCEFMRVSSYDATGHPSELRLDFAETESVAGKHVLVLEDIVDTGRTLGFIQDHLKEAGAKSVKFCALIRMEDAPKEPPVDFLGLTLEKGYIIGYGMDLGGRFRNLPWIQLKP